ncbi:hypothetical protein PAE3209a [Pyrobaculum aerophilum str. IM2]|uniref:Uncharacterized protein n=2 Tax=Pyrobaculum TaxID=2276 RepID=Q8ZTK4_PYRAE|nr:hypothetical protein PAE3209a [Pyrobaculum aerophilum str. IM2]AFA38548.1 hypothetical protein Pogu_0521 [Pyrobaculum oguniense TE7]
MQGEEKKENAERKVVKQIETTRVVMKFSVF